MNWIRTGHRLRMWLRQRLIVSTGLACFRRNPDETVPLRSRAKLRAVLRPVGNCRFSCWSSLRR